MSGKDASEELISFYLTRYCLGYQMKKYEMGSACGTQGFGWET
jgi:hypothetical protein